jgi:phosphatidylethanolamine-binding protein (PEBP) family uncharacterized protein
MDPRQRQNPLVCAVLTIALGLAGCGSSSSSSKTATTQASTGQATAVTTTSTSTPTTTSPAKEKLPNVSLPLKIPIKAKSLPKRYTCDGANVSLPFTWSEIPAKTVELDLFIFNVAPVHGKLVPVWAVAGLKPSLRGIPAGNVPAGTIIGRNGVGQNRYSLCPPKGTTGNYVALLDALPQAIPVKPGFDPESLVNKAVTVAEFEGRIGFSYKRG